jgi:putative phosphoesterase
MQKIAILSDIHGNMPALEKVMEDISSRQIECVVNLGDHISGPLWPKETVQFLMKQDWVQIKGNHDRQLVEGDPDHHGLSDGYAYQRINNTELEWLRQLPPITDLQNEILLIHGSPSSDSTFLLETVEYSRARLAAPGEITSRLGDTKYQTILCGHSHIPRVVELPGKRLLVNPGSVGLPAYDDNVPEYLVMETGSPHARYAVMERINGHWRTNLITIPYDYHQAADQACKNNRPDWEIGLRTGYMQRL